MISEIVLLLAFLGFLCIRNEFVRRTWAFVLAMLLWGSSRLLMELAFRGGAYEYSWGSLPSAAAAVCLSLCLLAMFVACRRPPRRPAPGETDGQPHRQGNGVPGRDASGRLRDLLDPDRE